MLRIIPRWGRAGGKLVSIQTGPGVGAVGSKESREGSGSGPGANRTCLQIGCGVGEKDRILGHSKVVGLSACKWVRMVFREPGLRRKSGSPHGGP